MSGEPLRRVEAAGMVIAYRRAGSGPPLVLLHGGLSDSRDWRPQLENLAPDFDVIAWDTPGCGQTPDPAPSFDFPDWADALATFLDGLDVADAHVLGLSWGSTLAQVFWRRHPARARSLILAGSYAGWKGSLPAEEVEARITAARRQLEDPAELIAAFMPTLVGADTPPEVAEEVRAIMEDLHPEGTRLMLEAMAAADTRDFLGEIDAPVLVIHGEDDVRSPLPVAEAVAAAIPRARLVRISGAGHMSNLEQPRAFNSAVREFCAEVEARG